MQIAIDFDGTVVTHDYPNVGYDIGAVRILKALLAKGHDLILFTMRSATGLANALEWFQDNDVTLYGVQYNPTQAQWTCSNKCYAQLYIDDAALGCPLKFDLNISPRPYVDWDAVEQLLIKMKIL